MLKLEGKEEDEIEKIIKSEIEAWLPPETDWEKNRVKLLESILESLQK
jgi:hypothetical protein